MSKNKWLIPVVILLLGAGAAGAWTYHNAASSEAEADGDIAANEALAPASGSEDVVTPTPAPEAATPTPAAADAPTVKPEDIHVTVNGSTPQEPRSIGAADAPVTMVEYSSLTCPHCAHAHETVLPRLIKDYVEKGKLRIVFSDFPLNQQALDASKVSRCVANDQYFGFLTLLFGSIENWAYSGTHPQSLITDATLTGLTADRAKECLNDKGLEDSILAGAQDAAKTKGINSTPTFIFNNGAATIEGAKEYPEFQTTIDGLLAKAGK